MKTVWAALMTAILLTASGCTSEGVDDAAVTAKVKAKLVADKETSAIKIAVETHGGVVTLTGVVPSELEKSRAGEIARRTEGVRQIVNQITVNPQSYGATNMREKVEEATERTREKVQAAAEVAGEVMGDAAILALVKSQFAAQGIKGPHVEVKDREVVLTGRVASEQDRSRAEEIARGTKGVSQVRNQLAVNP